MRPPSLIVLDPSKSTLEFNFAQAGAQNKGKFKQLAASFDFAPTTWRPASSTSRSRSVRWTP
jgi:polyisoprenoid-binding protein YceI